MPGMLDAALAWAARGFRVFPLAEGTRDTPIVPFVDTATTDPERIRALWRDPVMGIEQAHNVGVLTTGMIVVDIDVKNGKAGLDTFAKLGGQFDTLTVRTPSGGYHCYYRGPDSAGLVEGLGPGLDHRSHNNYVLAPGSGDVRGLYELVLDLPMREVPEPIKALLRPPSTRPEGGGGDVDDTAAAIASAVSYLRSVGPAIEGAGGDSHTYQVCCRVREFGVSEERAFELIRDEFNGRCIPPWDEQELRGKVFNAYAYATGSAGNIAPETLFDTVKIIHMPEGTVTGHDLFVKFGNAILPSELAPRRWLMRGLLLKEYVTALIAPGGAGKSTIALTIAAHLAMGLPFLDFPAPDRPTKSIVYNAEDDLGEQSRRLVAICTHYRLDYDRVRSMLALISADEWSFKLTTGQPPQLNVNDASKLIELAIDAEVGAVFLGPLVELHSGREDDNAQMAYVMGCLRELARRADVAVLVDHHTSKPPMAGAGQRAGDVNSSRGASSITNSARLSWTLYSATDKDCEDYGIKPDDRDQYVRFDSAKTNVSRKGVKPRWMKAYSVRLITGDDVGVFAPIDTNTDMELMAQRMSDTLAREIINSESSTCTTLEAAEMLRRVDPVYSQIGIKVLAGRIETVLRAYELDVRVHYELKGGRAITMLVLA